MEAVWDLRSERNLLGTHVDAQSGKWVAPVCHMWMCGLNRSTASPPLITLSAPPSDPPHPPPASLHTPALYARTALGIDDRRRRRQLFRVPLEGHGPVQRHLLRRHLCRGVHGCREHASSGALVRPRRSALSAGMRDTDWTVASGAAATTRHVTAHLSTGQLSGVVFESLQAFWPGLQILLGDVEPVRGPLRPEHALAFSQP